MNTVELGTRYAELCIVMQTAGTNLCWCAMVQLVEALCYKSEGRCFDSMSSTQPLREMSTRNIS